MANLIKSGAESNGISAELTNISDIIPEDIDVYDVIAFGCPSTDDEELDPEMDDFITTMEDELSGRTVALFGSSDSGDGQWMQDLADRFKECGASLICEPLIINAKPEGKEAANCVLFGKDIFNVSSPAKR